MSMLVSLEDMKAYLGITPADTSYDDFLNLEIQIASEAIEGYCGRIFSEATYTQTFYKDERLRDRSPELPMYHFPVSVVHSVTEVTLANTLTAEEIRNNKKAGILKRLDSNGNRVDWYYSGEKTLEINYTAGYADIPVTIQSVVYSVVGDKYAKKSNGISVDFGSDVQSVSIPGVLNVSFDYTLQANDRSATYGMILGNYVNVLNKWCSERSLIGDIEVDYVE